MTLLVSLTTIICMLLLIKHFMFLKAKDSSQMYFDRRALSMKLDLGDRGVVRPTLQDDHDPLLLSERPNAQVEGEISWPGEVLWQTIIENEIYAVSAYYDSRSEISKVRVIAAVHKNMTMDFKECRKKVSISCIYTNNVVLVLTCP